MEEREWEEMGNDCIVYHKNILTMINGKFVVTMISEHSGYNDCVIHSEIFEDYKTAKECFEEE